MFEEMPGGLGNVPSCHLSKTLKGDIWGHRPWRDGGLGRSTVFCFGVDEAGIDLPAQVRQLALEYNLMSAYTAFVAVDSMTGDHGITVGIPVPVPEGVRYETTVQQARHVQPGQSE
jgi:hypothetical protein